MDKETKLRSALFFVIGFLLVLSLVICIYIVAGERDLKPVEAEVADVVKDVSRTGVNSVKITYTVDGTKYNFAFDAKKQYEVGEKINVYYHTKKVTDIQTYKTSKLIFLCPIFGLLLCALGLFELYRKKNDGEAEFKTAVIGVVGDTQKLKIVTDGADEQPYEPTPEESAEVEVKKINKAVDEEIPAPIYEEPEPEAEEEATVSMVSEVSNVNEEEEEPAPVAEEEEAPAEEEEEPELQTPPEPVELPKEQTKQPKMVSAAEEEKSDDSGVEDIIKKVKEKSGDKIEVSEEDLKEAIKDVLADVIKEVKQEKKPKKVEQVRVIPNYYYISGTSLMYEEAGKEQKELSLKNVKNVTRTVNEAGNVVKLTVESDEVKCILTNMKNIDLEQLSNLLRNKLRAMDENFEEVVEHKEY